jgi:hypothetical protein
MIDDLHDVLRELFKSQVAGLLQPPLLSVSDDQIRFQPPDPDLRSHVNGLGTQKVLDLYLVDVRQNRKLRSNARERTLADGVWYEEPAPDRVDFHYLITAWSPATDAEDRTQAEVALLYEVLAVLLDNSPLNPSRVLNPTALSAIDPLIQEADLPTQVASVEGFPKLAEFWGTMGTDYRWKPVVYLIVTLPVARRSRMAGPMVTTCITEYRLDGSPETAEVWIQIGGTVLDATGVLPDGSPTPPVPLPGAWVRLENLSGEALQTTQTNEVGRFSFSGLRPGRYQLNWRATNWPVPPGPRVIDVPSPSGEYDLKFE